MRMGPDRVFNWPMDGHEYSLYFVDQIAGLRLDKLDHGPAFESPYKTEDLAQVDCCITPDKRLVLVHPMYPPYVLKRFPDTWKLEQITFGPIK